MRDDILLCGIAASVGAGKARIHLVRRREMAAAVDSESEPDEQWQRFKDAIAAVKQNILDMKNELRANRDAWTIKLFDTHLYLASDPELLASVSDGIRNSGLSAETAAFEAADQLSGLLENSGSAEMAERAADLRDVVGRIIAELRGEQSHGLELPPCKIILAAEDLSPLDTSTLEPDKVKGIVTAEGGYSCHTAIIARSLGIPAVTGIGEDFRTLIDCCEEFSENGIEGKDEFYAVVDGTAGEVTLNPGADKIAEVESLMASAKDGDFEEYRDKPTVSLDGSRIKLCAHLGGLNELETVAASGAEGIGLLRSEFLFIGSDLFPDEQKQFDAYRKVLEKMGNRRVVIRTLDIGGDKNVPAADIKVEQNPFLGVRGIRYSLRNIEVFRTQLRALLRASIYGRLAVMIPMAATEEEVVKAKEIFRQEERRLRDEGVSIADSIEFGIMIEVPSAALIAETLSRHVDFFSIGTNDLIQYTMAADRMNPAVADYYQPMHPAILKLLRMVTNAASAAGISCAVCGEAASDLEVIPELLRLGVNELSVSAPRILALRKMISEISTQ